MCFSSQKQGCAIFFYYLKSFISPLTNVFLASI